MLSVSARISGSRIFAKTSTRRTRLRFSKSPEPMKTRSRAFFPNAKMRECSRYVPTTLRTEMFSVSPGMPGRRQQMPRTKSSTRTPAREASTSLRMTARLFRPLTLIAMRASAFPLCRARISSSISAMTLSRKAFGATHSVSRLRGNAPTPGALNVLAASRPTAGSAVIRERSV